MIFRNADVVLSGGVRKLDLRVENGKIAELAVLLQIGHASIISVFALFVK